MSKINILDASVFNRIAAGEVVERPKSVVKELVENSLDAGATQIRVEVFAGGKQQIKVTDNGSGIASSDAGKAFLPHATSKIEKIEDLELIGTLGFRGEALASIASVAQVELISKQKSSESGQVVKIEGGQLLENKPVGCPDGTVITVNNLFYNVPARQKFLKGDRREETEITNLMARFILANPKVIFIYFANKKEVYRSTGKNLEEAVYTVYGRKTLENLIPFENTVGAIKLSGYIGKPNFSKSNRTYQTLIINGRYVVNSVVSAASYGAYQNYLMKGKFPFFIINMTMPLNTLDVNVHPNKLDVKFENSQTIYGIIHSTLTNTLQNANNILKVETKNIENNSQEIIIPTTTFSQNEGASFSTMQTAKEPTIIDIESTTEEELNAGKEQEAIAKKAKILSSFMSVNEDSIKAGTLKESTSPLTSALHSALNEANKPASEQTSAFDTILDDSSNLQFIGKVFNTFLLIGKDTSMFIIDQHAAHERLLYDRLVQQVNNENIVAQGLLVPHILSVNHLEEAFILENIKNIKALGFEIESFGGLSFKISSIPAVLSGINIDLFFNEILKDMTAINKTSASDLIKERLMQASCKSAVRGGDNLNELEVKTLFDKMRQSGMTLLCPHGRPVIVEVTRKEMDKWFKRIL